MYWWSTSMTHTWQFFLVLDKTMDSTRVYLGTSTQRQSHFSVGSCRPLIRSRVDVNPLDASRTGAENTHFSFLDASESHEASKFWRWYGVFQFSRVSYTSILKPQLKNWKIEKITPVLVLQVAKSARAPAAPGSDPGSAAEIRKYRFRP